MSDHENCPGCGNPIHDEETIATNHLMDAIISTMEYAVLNEDFGPVITALTSSLAMYTVQFGESPDTIVDALLSAIQHFEILDTEANPPKEPVQPS